MPRKKTVSKAKEPIKLRTKKRSNGNYALYLDYYNPDTGKHEYEYLKMYLIQENTPFDKLTNQNTMAAANAIKSERTAALLSEQAGLKRVEKSKILLKDWFSLCVEKSRGREREGMNRHTWARTIEYTGEIVRQYAGAGVRIVEVDKAFCIGFIEYLKHGYIINRGQQGAGQHLKPSSAEKKVSAFSYVLKEAIKEGLIKNNPFDQVDRADKIKVNESSREYLTEEELKRLADTPTASEETRRVYLFMCCCGLRISDVKALRWEDIERDGQRWRVKIRQQKTQTPIYLPLSEQARQYLPTQGEADPSDHIFASLPTEPAMNRTLKLWAKRAGIEKNVTLHTARHTCATLLLSKGVDLYTVSKILGHSEISTTQIYAKIIDKTKENAVDKLNNLF